MNREEAGLSRGGHKARPMMQAPCLHLSVPASATFLALMVCRNKGPQVRIPTLSPDVLPLGMGKGKGNPYGLLAVTSKQPHIPSLVLFTQKPCVDREGESHFTDEETETGCES